MPLNVIMYHYIRNNEEYEYDVFCRRRDEFVAQVNWLAKAGSIVSIEDCEKIEYFSRTEQNGFLLTFDDGYKDHLWCGKYLHSIGLSGTFFPSVNCLTGQLLDVNKIHLILGNKSLCNVHHKALEIIRTLLNSNPNIYLSRSGLQKDSIELDSYLASQQRNRYDSNICTSIKHVLQRDLYPTPFRTSVIDAIFFELYNNICSTIADSFYLNIGDLLDLKSMGMTIGSHGMTHCWLETLEIVDQEYEIIESFAFLQHTGAIDKSSVKCLCFPYGSFNNKTLNIMKSCKIDYGFTTQSGAISKEHLASKEALPRWDTNDWWCDQYRKPCFSYKKGANAKN